MRIVISGTHASGKSTLISDFAFAHPEFEVLPDPYELIDSASEADAGSFFAQLRLSAARLLDAPRGAHVIAERGPLDFVAYLEALEVLRRPTRSAGLTERGAALTATAMTHVDLLVVLPLSHREGIEVPDDEDPELRDAMNEALLELVDDPDLTGTALVVEITGEPSARLAQLEASVLRLGRGGPTGRGPSEAART